MRFDVRVVVLPTTRPADDAGPVLHLVVTPLDAEAEQFDVWPLAPMTLCGRQSEHRGAVTGPPERCERCVQTVTFLDTALTVLERLKARGWSPTSTPRECQNGHDLTEPGALYVSPQGMRQCVACRREQQKTRRAAVA